MATFRFSSKPECYRCRHMKGSFLIKGHLTDTWKIECSFQDSQAGHARVPSWCPKYGYLHDGKKEENDE